MSAGPLDIGASSANHAAASGDSVPHALASKTRPNLSEPPSPEFRVEGEFAVRAVLRELMSRQTLVTVYPEGRGDEALVTRIVRMDATGLELDVAGQPACALALARARHADCVAWPDRIETRFTLRELSMLDALGTPIAATQHPASGLERATLRSPIPAELYRIQRREAFRVQPPPEDEAYCVQRIAVGREARHPLIDLSAGGLSIRMATEDPAPSRGRIWRQCRIETAGGLVIPCELVARGVYEDAHGTRRVAFEFHAMPSEVLRRVQIYVIDIEKRQLKKGEG